MYEYPSSDGALVCMVCQFIRFENSEIYSNEAVNYNQEKNEGYGTSA